MKYEVPSMEIDFFNEKNIVRTSLTDGGFGDDGSIGGDGSHPWD